MLVIHNLALSGGKELITIGNTIYAGTFIANILVLRVFWLTVHLGVSLVSQNNLLDM